MQNGHKDLAVTFHPLTDAYVSHEKLMDTYYHLKIRTRTGVSWYSWIANQLSAHKKKIASEPEVLHMTIPRPPLENYRQGKSRSARTIFV